MVQTISGDEKKRGNPKRFPLLPLRDIVVFPHMVVPLFVGREKSILALQAAMSGNRHVFLAAQKSARKDEPLEDDIHVHGTLCRIIQLLNLPDRTVKVLIEGKRRGTITRFLPEEAFFSVEIAESVESSRINAELQAMMRRVKAAFETYATLTKKVPQETVTSVTESEESSRLADTVAAHLNLTMKDKQELLSTADPSKRLERLLELMGSEIEILQIEKKIHSRVKRQMDKTQKEYYLNEQMRAIQKELGGKDDFKQELSELEEKINAEKLSKEAKQKALAELKKLKLMSPMSAEAAVGRNYLDWLVSLPWGTFTKEKNDIGEAEHILEQDHYGLTKVKERIVEYLSVMNLVKKMKGPILCLVGPPGVGKTSLARSIARATGRNFVKMSLGGVRDEAEIRGHRRTYVGAMPGKIILNLKKAGSGNPVFLLDEIDKMSADFRGDPASALLEVLDPEQNNTFNDHFLDVDYDLSRVMFITTANSLHSIPRPLLDRLEVIRIEGYTETEKLEIARRYLVKKKLAEHGLSPEKVSVTDKAVVEIVRHYTREAGVRSLEREIATICRKIAYSAAKGKTAKVTLRPQQVRDLLGAHRFAHGSIEAEDSVGVVTGLAWTETGGELLNIEVAVLPGKGKLTITGKLGEVMQESAHAAVTYVRSRAPFLGLEREFFQNIEIHIHVPEGAIPKDGPSAGITMATAVTSALTGRTVRRDCAMTGEVTLRGRVLPIGGLKEKLLAAKRANIRVVIIPKANEKDIQEMPKEVLAGMRIHLVNHMDEVLEKALSGKSVTPEFLRPLDTAVTLGESSSTAH
ncbi:MAG: endopeptidase La [Deltaproteobacteria bacterium]|nr:endopeptidase La [Deltaproteobacteria bacterium]